MKNDISNSDDVISFDDITERVEELESDIADSQDDGEAGTFFNATAELKILSELLAQTKSGGGDHKWRGDWYPGSMIRDSYFVEAMQELVEDIGDLSKDAPSYLVIDWEATAENLRVDYTSIEFDGVTYWYR